MEASKFVMDAVLAIATTYAQKGIEITVEKAKDIIQVLCQKNPGLREQIDVDDMAERIQATARHVGRVAYNEDTLARFLEIPVPDLATLDPERLDLSMLYDHVKLEENFQEWLREWGYEVELGCALKGLKGVEYTPDVYGLLDTLHGQFEICISFVSDAQPDEDRVFALLGKIEAYAEAKKSFSYGDIFAIVTPHRFTPTAMNAMGLQNEQENYSVIPLDGGDIYVFENAEATKDRLDEFQDKVRQAEEESRQGRIKRAAQRPEEDVR